MNLAQIVISMAQSGIEDWQTLVVSTDGKRWRCCRCGASFDDIKSARRHFGWFWLGCTRRALARAAPASLCAEALAVFEALKLAMACEVGDEHIWVPNARTAVTAFAARLTQADVPASGASGEVGEAEVEAFIIERFGPEFYNQPDEIQKREVRSTRRCLRAAARVRAASPDESWRAERKWCAMMADRIADLHRQDYAQNRVPGQIAAAEACDELARIIRAQPDPTPVPSTDATGGMTVEAFGLLKVVDDWATRWIHDRSHQASGSPDFVHGYQRGASHVAIELRKLVIEHMPDFHQRVAAEQSRAALRSNQGGR